MRLKVNEQMIGWQVRRAADSGHCCQLSWHRVNREDIDHTLLDSYFCPLAQLTGQIHLISANSWLLILSCQTCMSPECFVSFFKPSWNERGVQSRTLPANLDFILRNLQFLSGLLDNPNFCLERIKFIFGF